MSHHSMVGDDPMMADAAEESRAGGAGGGGGPGGGGGDGAFDRMSVEVAEGSELSSAASSSRAVAETAAADGFAGFAMDQPLMVVPGRVIHLTGREAFVRAVEGDPLMPELRRVAVTQRAVSDHRIDSYADALRTVWHRRGHAPPPRPPTPFASVIAPGGGANWTPCAVCGSDVIWTAAVAGSDAWRVHATHHCRACGEVVCAFCAPAGDRVAADSLGEFDKLTDRRVPLPSRDYLQAARVCLVCSYNVFDLF